VTLFLELLPFALVCALFPWAIVAVILMLASDRPSNAVWWLTGWTLSTFVVGAVIILFFNGFDYSKPSTPKTVACVIQVLLGLLLLPPGSGRAGPPAPASCPRSRAGWPGSAG